MFCCGCFFSTCNLILGKAATILAPLALGDLVNSLAKTAAGETTAATASAAADYARTASTPVVGDFLGTLPFPGLGDPAMLPILWLASYGLARVAASGFSELRTFLFARVVQKGCRNQALLVFDHLHTLDAEYLTYGGGSGHSTSKCP
eukprot:g17981.t1